MEHKSKIDIAVLLIFFCRYEQFGKVFEQIKKARPSRLYLYQDGARDSKPDDVIGIQKCREIAEDIDWECEVHRFYQEKNFGCDPSEYIAQKWMFETEEMGIVLEDDDVPAQSFFPFCKELLERYKDDERINMICGMNNLEVYNNCPYDYFFSTSGSITGWASWKRVVNKWTDHIQFIDNPYYIEKIKDIYSNRFNVNKLVNHYKYCNEQDIVYYEAILSANALVNSRLNIVVTKNQISNIGITENATHSVSNLKVMPKGIRRIFFMPTYELDFPLKHPEYVIEDLKFKKKLDRIMGRPIHIRIHRKICSICLRIRYGDFKGLLKSLKRKLKM